MCSRIASPRPSQATWVNPNPETQYWLDKSSSSMSQLSWGNDVWDVQSPSVQALSPDAATPPDDNRLHEVYSLPMPPVDGRGRRGAVAVPSEWGTVIRELEDSKGEVVDGLDVSGFGDVGMKFRDPFPIRLKRPTFTRQDVQLVPNRNRATKSALSPVVVARERKQHTVSPDPWWPSTEPSEQQLDSFLSRHDAGDYNPTLDFLKGTSLSLISHSEIKIRKEPKQKRIARACVGCRESKVVCDEILPQCGRCVRLCFNCCYLEKPKKTSAPISLSPSKHTSKTSTLVVRRKVDNARARAVVLARTQPSKEEICKPSHASLPAKVPLQSIGIVQTPTSTSALLKAILDRNTTPLIYDSTDPSDAFQTDAFWSDDYSGSDEFDIHEHFDSLMSIQEVSKTANLTPPKNMVSSRLSPAKKTMIESLMKEFWILFNEQWSTAVEQRGGGSSGSSNSAYRSSPSASSQNTNDTTPPGDRKGKRRKTNDDGGNNSEDEDDRDPKRPKNASSLQSDKPKSMFACPYRKHNPQTYHTRNRAWRTCALNSFENIARLKGHLYRHHRIFQCPRCKGLFPNKVELDAHFISIEGCELNTRELQEGINDDTEKRLRSRKKAHRDQTEAERWVEIYGVLFPNETVPTPYFEEIETEPTNSPHSHDLSNYEEYSRTELPRIFRSALEESIAREAQPIEERLRSQLVGLIRECQDRMFLKYRSSQVQTGGSGDGPKCLDTSVKREEHSSTAPLKGMDSPSTSDTSLPYLEGSSKSNRDSGYDDNSSAPSIHQSIPNDTPHTSDNPTTKLETLPSYTSFGVGEDLETSYFADDIARYDINQQFPDDIFGESNGFVDGQNLFEWEFGGGFGGRF
ncbi:Zn2/Cys6 DNA-binding protein [Glarea lozoyensis ATCC 20868]|uniref:Zn2/Cys6 DNA-binding protein n=1 Tax=Glarea lozoyensis (strain ATCC 20868 / MF5171) TaxID=1116229 RepID=S3CUP4_GLAL2|nr:Zn2/Cys6 DNA-binding protein [Glarea lozoyensis ATCC 20868]EPE28709.1 Zn2/Cys6 DNA-binding protein [Glarea lozoyensis ATCC 20868]